jgi:NAD-dependent histone deacetylase SIR2
LREEVLNVKETSAVHKFIRTLAETGRLLRCYTQNIDGLEEREGLVVNMSHGKGKRKRPSPLVVDDDRTAQEKGCQVVQLHGDLRSLRCMNCQCLTDYTLSSVSILLSGQAPRCPACETASAIRQASGKRGTKIGTLRPNVVLYGEEHPEADMVGKLNESDIRAAPDMMVILGTSLRVHGLKRIVKEFAKAVHAKGGMVVFVNNTAPTESAWNDTIDHHVEMDCDDWVVDLKKRRAGIWERQTKLPVPKVLKTGSGNVAVATKAIAFGTKENVFSKVRRIIEPKTPSSKRRKALAETTPQHTVPKETPYMSPPSTSKRVAYRRNPLSKPSPELEHVNRTPTKRRKTEHELEDILASPPSPPCTPTALRLITVEIVRASPHKKLSSELKIYEDDNGASATTGDSAAGCKKEKKTKKSSKGKASLVRRRSTRKSVGVA